MTIDASIINDVGDTLLSILDLTHLISKDLADSTLAADQANSTSVSFKDYIKLISAEFLISNVISSALQTIASNLSAISAQVSVMLSPLSIPDYELSTLMLSVKLTIDEMKQLAAAKIDSAISTVTDTVKNVMKAVNGWIDTSITEMNVVSAGQSLEKTLNNVNSVISKLPLPISIPGLDSITKVVASLTSMTIPSLTSATEEIKNKVESLDLASTAKDEIKNQIKNLI